jgi:cytochrome c oxidase subunit 2
MMAAGSLAEWTTEASGYAARIDHTFWLLCAVSGLILLLVMALVVTFVIRYRRGSQVHRGDLPETLKHDVEIGWTAATLFLFLFIFWWAASTELSALNRPKNALEIHVVAKQWMWRFQHPSGAREIDTLHVPANTPVRLVMTSEDVIHDLYLPALRLKQDILPGRYTDEWFTATKPGTYYLTCAEFCGTDHSVMGGKLVIVTPEDYARWTAAQPEGDDLAHQGEALFRTLGCSGCHTPGSSVHAPTCTASTAAWCIFPTAAPSRPTMRTCATPSCCPTGTSSPASRRSCRASRASRPKAT